MGASSALLLPMEPEAPGWLTITTFWPSVFSISAAVTRVTWSVEPPAAQGTMMVMGRSGFHCWASTGPPSAASAAAKAMLRIKVRFCMVSPGDELDWGNGMRKT